MGTVIEELCFSVLRWFGLVAGNAIVCLVLVASTLAREPAEIAAVIAALSCWALLYGMLDGWLGWRGNTRWQRRLRRAALIKMVTQLLPVLEVLAGIAMLSLLGSWQLTKESLLFLATLGTGALLSVAVGAIMLLSAVLQRERWSPHVDSKPAAPESPLIQGR